MSDTGRETARKFLLEAVDCKDAARKVLLLELADAWIKVASIMEGRQVTAHEVMLDATDRPANSDKSASSDDN